MPAIAGPTTRDALNIDELSAMAFIRSARPTISTMKDWRAGMSNALTTPEQGGESEDVPDLHRLVKPVSTDGGERKGQQHGGGLGGDDHALAAVAVGTMPPTGAEERRGSGWQIRCRPAAPRTR